MAYIRVSIDGETVLDGESGTWEAKTPDFIAKEMANVTSSPNAASPSPWMRGLMLIIAESIMTDTFTNVEVSTRGNAGWSINVKYAIELGS